MHACRTLCLSRGTHLQKQQADCMSEQLIEALWGAGEPEKRVKGSPW